MTIKLVKSICGTCGFVAVSHVSHRQGSMNFLVDTPDRLQNDNFSRAADLFENLLKNKTDAVKANNDGLMTIDEEDFEQIDEATITRIKKLNAKIVEQLESGCTRKSPWERHCLLPNNQLMLK